MYELTERDAINEAVKLINQKLERLRPAVRIAATKGITAPTQARRDLRQHDRLVAARITLQRMVSKWD